MKQLNTEMGRLGERLASEFLAKKGYKILEKNFRTQFGEIDLVAAKDGKLIFVEVKLKMGEDFGPRPEEMIGKRKILQIERTAQRFLMAKPENENLYTSYQIDAVCIVLDAGGQVKRISQYENIGF